LKNRCGECTSSPLSAAGGYCRRRALLRVFGLAGIFTIDFSFRRTGTAGKRKLLLVFSLSTIPGKADR
jgi:hypothetical protein